MYDPVKYKTPTGTKLNCKGWVQEAALRMCKVIFFKFFCFDVAVNYNLCRSICTTTKDPQWYAGK